MPKLKEDNIKIAIEKNIEIYDNKIVKIGNKDASSIALSLN